MSRSLGLLALLLLAGSARDAAATGEPAAPGREGVLDEREAAGAAVPGGEGEAPAREPPLLAGAPTLRLELVGGAVLEGAFAGGDAEVVRLGSEEGVREVPLALVERAELRGRELGPEELRQALVDYLEWQVELVGRGPAPSPWLVGGLCVLWPGAGHLLLAQPGVFAASTAADALLLGSAAWLVFRQEDYRAVPSLLLLDLALRAATADDAARKAAQRRSSRRRAEEGLEALRAGGSR